MVSISGVLCALGITALCATSTTTNAATTTTKKTTTTSTTSTIKTTAKTTSTSTIKTTSVTSSTSAKSSSSVKSTLVTSTTSSSLSSSISAVAETEAIPIVTSAGPAATTIPVATAAVVAGNATNLTTADTASSFTVGGTILVIARDSASALVASSGLNGYGIPFETLIVPSTGATLPTLNSSTTAGNYGGIVVASQVSYQYGTTFASALTDAQWNQIYAYQLGFGVRMVQYDVYPGPNFGSTALGGCCDTGVEQLISFSNTASFKQAGLIQGATMSTSGLWHYPATISDTTTTTEIAQFAANANFASTSTAGVINNFSGREQMVFFISWATDWSPTSNFLQHAYITWMTRGLYAGYRRTYLNTQIDDMFLETGLYVPNGTNFRLRAADMTGIKSWVTTINAKMNTGSKYYVEIGHNGNGNIEASASTTTGESACGDGPIEYSDVPDTALEFQKPLGTGTDFWPSTPTAYDWTTTCLNLDSLKVWFATAANRDAFAHISHTFSHEEQNNATYADVNKEISFNQAWFTQSTLGAASMFTSDGLIPPAITGLHNGDALRAWADNGLKHCVGDNTRSVLRNSNNVMWPLYTTVAANGYAGIEIVPRWATRIYYNCDTPACTTQEWIDTSAGVGGFADLLASEKADTTRHLLGLYHEGYMFHQANLRNSDAEAITINGVSAKISIFQAWVETIVQEYVRLVNWPILTLKQGDLATSFADRMTRDGCAYKLTYKQSASQITGVTVSSTGNTCSVPIPVTFPGPVTSTQGFTTEQVGNDPLTVWVKLAGSPVSFTLSTPVAVA